MGVSIAADMLTLRIDDCKEYRRQFSCFACGVFFQYKDSSVLTSRGNHNFFCLSPLAVA